MKIITIYLTFLFALLSTPSFAENQISGLKFAGSSIAGGKDAIEMGMAPCSEFYVEDAKEFSQDFNSKAHDSNGYVGTLQNNECSSHGVIGRCITSGQDENGDHFKAIVYFPATIMDASMAETACQNSAEQSGAQNVQTKFERF